MDRKIRISLKNIVTIQKSGDKSQLEAFAFAVLLGLSFQNRVLFKNVRKQKGKLHIGTDRLKRCITNGIKYGFLSDEGNFYSITSLHKKKERTIRVSFACIDKRYTIRNNNYVKSSRIKETALDDIVSFLAGVTTEVKVRQHEYVSDCFESNGASSYAECMRRSQRLKKLLKKHTCPSAPHDLVRGTTLKTLGKELGVTQYKVRTIIKYELSKKRLKRDFESESLYTKFPGLGIFPPKKVCGESFNKFLQRLKKFYVEVNFIIREAGYTGFVTSANGKPVYRTAYVYHTTRRSV